MWARILITATTAFQSGGPLWRPNNVEPLAALLLFYLPCCDANTAVAHTAAPVGRMWVKLAGIAANGSEIDSTPTDGQSFRRQRGSIPNSGHVAGFGR
jgi:hypothetical protein